MTPDEVKRRLIEAHIHLTFCEEIYQSQLQQGRHFLHEHPASAASWTEEVIVNLMGESNVATSTCHMCQYGMKQLDRDGVVRHVLKPARWMSSSTCILQRLSRKCPRGSKSAGGHEHTTLFGKEKTQVASIYPPALCTEILLGARDQLHAKLTPANAYLGNIMKSSFPVCDLSGRQEYGEVRPTTDGPSDMDDWDPNDKEEARRCAPVYPAPRRGQKSDEEKLDNVKDSVTGDSLPGHLVKAAHEEEMHFMNGW